MTLSNRNISALLAICVGNSPVPGEFPAQRPVTRSFDVFFHLPPNKRLSKQSWGWWFETPSGPLWRHSNEAMSCCSISLPSSCRIAHMRWSKVKDLDESINTRCVYSVKIVSKVYLVFSITLYPLCKIWGCACSTVPFKLTWSKWYICNSTYYHHQSGSFLQQFSFKKMNLKTLYAK